MEYVAEALIDQRTHARSSPLVFLDTGVIVEYLRGDRLAEQLFAAEEEGRIQFAINPIVLQELLLAPGAVDQPNFDHIREHLRVLPIDIARAEALLPQARRLRNRLAHANDILIASSAEDCDFLVTTDAELKNLATAGKARVVSPEELLGHLQAA